MEILPECIVTFSPETTGPTCLKIFMVVSSTPRIDIGKVSMAFLVTRSHHHPKAAQKQVGAKVGHFIWPMFLLTDEFSLL